MAAARRGEIRAAQGKSGVDSAAATMAPTSFGWKARLGLQPVIAAGAVWAGSCEGVHLLHSPLSSEAEDVPSSVELRWRSGEL